MGLTQRDSAQTRPLVAYVVVTHLARTHIAGASSPTSFLSIDQVQENLADVSENVDDPLFNLNFNMIWLHITRAMTVPWGLLTILSLVYHTESRCSPTSYYTYCWIRWYPGIFIDSDESQKRRTASEVLTRSGGSNAAETVALRDIVILLYLFSFAFHLHCPTLESCILSHRCFILYNITKGEPPYDTI